MSGPIALLRRTRGAWLIALVVGGAGLGGCAAPMRVAVGRAAGHRLHDTARTWTWIPLAGTACGDGSPAGFAINRVGSGRDLVIALAGGGACWSAATCFGSLRSATHLVDGYGARELAADRNLGSVLLRRDKDGLFPLANLVYVPYCTGDLHAGDRIAEYPDGDLLRRVHHVGARNLDAILVALGPVLAKSPRVFVVGESAGGYGAILNLGRVQAAVPHAHVHVIDDSGPPLTPIPERLADWLANWGMKIPSDCAQCHLRLDAWLDHWARLFPDDRIALLSYDRDAVIAGFSGLNGDQIAFFLDVMAPRLAATRSQRLYRVDGFFHVVLLTPFVRAGDLGPVAWLRRMIAGAPGWENVR